MTDAAKRSGPSPEERDKLMARVAPCPLTGCWFWLGSINRKGYGQAYVRWTKTSRAHRVFYEMLRDSIPDGLQLDHLCRQPSCVNPDHLEPVTSRENTMRGENFAARNAQKTHCAHGHPLTPENIDYVGYKQRERKCRKCRVARNAEQYRRRAPRDDRERARKYRAKKKELAALRQEPTDAQ